MIIVLLIALLLSGIQMRERTYNKRSRYDLYFRSSSDKTAAKLKDIPFKDNTQAFTVCLRVNQTKSICTYFSYAVPSQTNSIVIESRPKSTELWVTNYKMVLDRPAVLNKYIHYCYTWSGSDGKIQIYEEGKKISEKVFEKSKNKIIKGKGLIVLGQDQDSYGGGFDASTSFEGSITDVEVWDEVITDKEAFRAAENSYVGNIVSWQCVVNNWELQEVIRGYTSFEDFSIDLEYSRHLKAVDIDCMGYGGNVSYMTDADGKYILSG